MSILADKAEAVAVDVSCSDDALSVTLEDGRTVSAPLAWFPRLLAARRSSGASGSLSAGELGFTGRPIDEDISIASLLQPENFTRAREPARLRNSARRLAIEVVRSAQRKLQRNGQCLSLKKTLFPDSGSYTVIQPTVLARYWTHGNEVNRLRLTGRFNANP